MSRLPSNRYSDMCSIRTCLEEVGQVLPSKDKVGRGGAGFWKGGSNLLGLHAKAGPGGPALGPVLKSLHHGLKGGSRPHVTPSDVFRGFLWLPGPPPGPGNSNNMIT